MVDSSIKTIEDFFEYLAGYMADGDTLECELMTDDKTDEEFNRYTLYGGGFSHYPLLQFDVVYGLVKY